jgi:GNAT superfamily N-acetyltransferase
VADLLVRLYDLPPPAPVVEALAGKGIAVRRALAGERAQVVDFARQHGSEAWAGECAAAFARQPLACFVATERAPAPEAAAEKGRAPETLIGFACYEATCRNFFGPELVHVERRGLGIGRALLLAALDAMRAEGYAYAIVGWASSIDFYQRAVGAVVIEGSEPGIYPAPLGVASGLLGPRRR